MMGLSTIKAMNREAAERAAQENLRPFVVWDVDEVDTFPPFPFPFIGDLRPDGWELVSEWFVDTSGLGASNEPAKSADQLKQAIKDLLIHSDGEVYGFALIKVGQFQAYLGVFEKKE